MAQGSVGNPTSSYCPDQSFRRWSRRQPDHWPPRATSKERQATERDRKEQKATTHWDVEPFTFLSPSSATVDGAVQAPRSHSDIR